MGGRIRQRVHMRPTPSRPGMQRALRATCRGRGRSSLAVLVVVLLGFNLVPTSRTGVTTWPEAASTGSLGIHYPGLREFAYTANVTTVRVGFGPGYAAYDSANGFVYVINQRSGNVSVINGTSVVGSFGISGSVRFVTYDPSHDLLYFSKNHTDNVTIARNTTILGNLTVGDAPFYSSYDPRNGLVYVACVNGADVGILNGTSALSEVSVGNSIWSYPFYTVYDNRNGYVYVTGLGTQDNVYVIGGTSVLANVSVPGEPLYATYDGTNGYVYVSYNANGQGYGFSAINGTSVIKSFSAGPNPGQGAYDAGNGYVYVPNTYSNNVSVLSGTSIIATLSVGSRPSFATYDPGNGYVYVSNSYSNSVSVVSGTTVIGNLSTGMAPGPSIYDPRNGNIYVSNVGGSNLSVISTPPARSFPVTFTETGLPGGSAWSVTLDGTSNTSSTTTVGFLEPNGTYDFQIGPPSGYTAKPISGSVTLNGTGQGISIRFVPIFSVTFTQRGLPAGASWSVNLSGTLRASTTNTITLAEPNGTYPFIIGPVLWYFATPSSGSLVVSGLARTIAVDFLLRTYPVTFELQGEAPPSSWTVTLAGITNGSSGTMIGFEEPNGTNYPFGVTWSTRCRILQPSSGIVNVSGAPATVVITDDVTSCVPPVYTVNFTERGLPSGTIWWVTPGFYGASATFSDTANLSLNGMTGTFSYIVSTSDRTYSAPAGSFTVTGPGGSVEVVFSRVTYTVTFTETGLPPGSNWSAALNGSPESNSGSIRFTGITNGTYPFTIGSVAGYRATPNNGSITVAGRPMSASIVFKTVTPAGGNRTSPAQFLGLPANEGYAVLLSGVAALAVAAFAIGFSWSQRRNSSAASDKPPNRSAEGLPPTSP